MPKKNDATTDIANVKKELYEKESEIQLLQETFRIVSSELNLEKLFNTIAVYALQIVQAETLLIPILDNNNKTYTYRAGAGINSDEIVGESLPLDFGVCGWVWKHKKAWWRGVLNELDEHERNQWEKQVGTLILVPLQGRRTFLGGIAATNKKNGEEFSRRDLNMLSMFAGVVSIAIENALAVKELEDTQRTLIEHQKRLERLNKQYSESSYKVEQLSLYDALTGLPNRSLFRDRINTLLPMSSREKQGVGILMIDINNFKTMNDALGHDNGDQILIEFSKRIQHTLNPNETLSRLGSDEFILILPDTDIKKTTNRARKILNNLKTPFQINHNEISIHACIGISLFPDHGSDRGTLLRHADIALSVAKKDNSELHVFDDDKDESEDAQISLSIDIDHAFTERQFELYYQPKIDIKSNTLVSAEALGRWVHPTRGMIAPNIFIEALEQYNLIDKYTYQAIKQAVKAIKHWTAAGHNIKIAINISTRSLMNPNFVDKVQSIITDFSISRRLIFERTESLFLSDYDHVFDSLTRIRALGIELSIDDFGTGYSSLSRLKRLPVNELKIDQSFIREMTENIDDQIIVKSIIDLAHNLGLTVVAEGVETRDNLNQLNKLGCDIAQGYLISRPMPEKDFEAFMDNYKT